MLISMFGHAIGGVSHSNDYSSLIFLFALLFCCIAYYIIRWGNSGAPKVSSNRLHPQQYNLGWELDFTDENAAESSQTVEYKSEISPVMRWMVIALIFIFFVFLIGRYRLYAPIEVFLY